MLNFRMHLSRQPYTLTSSVIVPGFALAFLSLLYILIPRKTGARVSYLTVILLTQVQFLRTMTSFVPTSRENPASQEIFFGTSIVMMVCIVFSVLVMWLETLLDDGVIDKLGVMKIKKLTVKTSARRQSQIPELRKMSAIDIQRELFNKDF